MKPGWIALIVAFSASLAAANAPPVFQDRQQEMRFKELMTELRCLVCQNQSLEDSNAPLARDLRDQAYAMMRDGASNDQILQYMVDRYGDFVRYRPPLKPLTLLLWLGPVLLLVAAAALAWRWVASQTEHDEQMLSNEDQARADRLLALSPPVQRREPK